LINQSNNVLLQVQSLEARKCQGVQNHHLLSEEDHLLEGDNLLEEDYRPEEDQLPEEDHLLEEDQLLEVDHLLDEDQIVPEVQLPSRLAGGRNIFITVHHSKEVDL
jgi:hypothetical protein